MARKSGAGGVILVALVLALATAYLIWAYFRKMDEESRKNWQPVVVAKQDLKIRTKVTRDMLKLEAFPKGLIAENAVKDISKAENLMLSRDIRSMEQLRSSDLMAEGAAPTLAYKIPEGMRAIAIGAGEVMSVGASVQPGDHVDIVASFLDRRSKQDVTRMIMQNVLVLAVNRGQTDPGDKGGGASSSMTLAVRPEKTELLAAADRIAAIRITLRPINDTNVYVTADVTPDDLSGSKPVVKEAEPASPPPKEHEKSPPPIREEPKVKPPPPVIRGTQESR